MVKFLAYGARLDVSFNDMLSILSDRQKAIVNAMTMRLDTKQSLAYLTEHGYEMSERTFFRQKEKIQSLKLKRLYHIAKIGFVEQHLERIDQVKLIEQLMWEQYHTCKNPYQKVKILESIVSVQPYLSSYYEATHFVVKEAGDKNIMT